MKRRKEERLKLAEEAWATRMEYFEASRSVNTSTSLQCSAFALEVTTCLSGNRTEIDSVVPLSVVSASSISSNKTRVYLAQYSDKKSVSFSFVKLTLS